jgi:hypothetical protein
MLAVKERGFEVLDMLYPSVPLEISTVEQLNRNTCKHSNKQFQRTAISASSGIMTGVGFAQGGSMKARIALEGRIALGFRKRMYLESSVPIGD